MIGPLINGGSIVLGSVGGAFLGNRINENLRSRMPLVFGVSCMGLGIALIMKVRSLPVVILSLLVGTVIDELICL